MLEIKYWRRLNGLWKRIEPFIILHITSSVTLKSIKFCLMIHGTINYWLHNSEASVKEKDYNYF